LINRIKELLVQPEPEPEQEPPTREPLSYKEIQDALIRCRQSTTWDYGFEAGVKYAEKMYGIGVGNE
jgi:hypothetical protein